MEILVDTKETVENGKRMALYNETGKEVVQSEYCFKAMKHITAPQLCYFDEKVFEGLTGKGRVKVFDPNGKILLEDTIDFDGMKSILQSVASTPAWPIKILEAKSYDDGGTIAYFTIDSNGQSFEFCIDHRLMTSTLNSFYLYATHPTWKGAKLLKVKSPAEKDFANQVKSSLDTQFGSDQKNLILKKYQGKSPGMSELEIGIAVLSLKVEGVLR